MVTLDTPASNAITRQTLGWESTQPGVLKDLEQTARVSQPFREVEPYIPEPFEKWEQEFAIRDPETVFLATVDSSDVDTRLASVGTVTALESYFMGVHPTWQGRGIAMVLKVQYLTEAKKRGFVRMETENHEDDVEMLNVNRKLGFTFTAPEVACVNRL